MRDNDLERRVRRAVEQAAPDVIEQVLSSCGQQKGTVPMNTKPNRQYGRWQTRLMAAAAALVLVGAGAMGSLWWMRSAVDAVVTLDVNPSVSLEVNRAERVIDALPLNDDAKSIVGDMQLAGTPLDVAVNALVGSMMQKGYLNEGQNTILVSVENDNAQKGARLQQKVADGIGGATDGGRLQSAVLGQTVAADESLKKLAATYDISPGKAALIWAVTEQDETLRFEALANLSVSEIALLMDARDIQTQSVQKSGQASGEGYIGHAAAKKAAYAHAGVNESAVGRVQVELDADDGVMVYEVEFWADGVQYEYDIDAHSGAVRKVEHETAIADGAGALIGEQQAARVALANAGVNERDATKLQSKMNRSRGVYLVSFTADGVQYEYEINALTGLVYSRKSGAAAGVASTAYISADVARQTAFAHAGAKLAQVQQLSVQLDDDDAEYEVRFVANGLRYEYEIDARTGVVRSYEAEDAGAGTGGSRYLSAEDARQAALSHRGLTAGRVQSLWTRLDGDDGVYEVDFIVDGVGYEYEIDAVSGKVLHCTTRDAAVLPDTTGDVIGAKAARQKALEHARVSAGAARFEKTELDRDDGVYEIEFTANGVEYEYEIDALRGTVYSYESEKIRDGQAASSGTTLIGEEAAQRAAYTHAGITAAKAQPKKAKLDRDDGVYEIEFIANGVEYEYEIDAVSGTVRSYERGPARQTAATGTANATGSGADIGLAKARQAALNHAGVRQADAKKLKAKLDRDDGVYEVEFTAGGVEYEYEIDAATGAVRSYNGEPDDSRYDDDYDDDDDRYDDDDCDDDDDRYDDDDRDDD